jgi:hypothetical protein
LLGLQKELPTGEVVPIAPPTPEEGNTTTESPSEMEETDTMAPYYTTIGTDTSVQPSKETGQSGELTSSTFYVSDQTTTDGKITSNGFVQTTTLGEPQYTTLSPNFSYEPGIFENLL